MRLPSRPARVGARGLCLALAAPVALPVLIVLCLGSLTFAPAIARGQQPSEAELDEARHAFEEATRLFDAGDYEAAATEFRAAFELTRHPDLWFNIYLAEERAGRLVEARDALELYLRDGTVEGEQRRLLGQRLERLRARVAARTAPATAPVPEPPPEQEQEQLIRDAPEFSGAADSSEPSAPPPVATQPPAAAIGMLVTAGILAVSFVIFAALSEVEDQRLEFSCGRLAGSTCTSEQTGPLEGLNIAADASWVAALVAGAIGVVLFVALPAEPAPVESAAIDLSPSVILEDGRVSGASLELRGRF